MNINIEKMTLSDLDKIKDILITDFDDYWNYSILKEELLSQNSYYIVAKYNNKIVGFAGIKVILDEADIMNIVVKKSYRNNGIGRSLLENLINLSLSLDCNSITLEVNEENQSAINLYTKFNFKKIGIRKNYYKDKNGIIMKKDIIKNTQTNI